VPSVAFPPGDTSALMIRLESSSFAAGLAGNIIRIACYKKEGPVKYLADLNLEKATITIAITIVSFALLWLIVTLVYALR
jgi:hypothetical protein